MRSISLLLILSAFLAGRAWAASASVDELIRQRAASLESFYQDLHEHPELSGEEKRTAEKVAAEFRALGLEVIEGIGGTGVVGILRNGKGATTLVRSELDALPVNEDTGLPYKSKTLGKMHACGHDFHATALVGTAYVMANSKDQWGGTLVFLAQPAEETAKGAKAMIRDDLFKKIPKPDQLLALHTSGVYPKGTVGITSGFALANVDSVDVTFKGKGTHGSKPENGIDPFIQAAEFTLKLQTLLGREKAASKPAVISVGSIHGGTRYNIIPDEVKMQLTVRTYDADVRLFLKRRIQEVASGIARTSGAPDPVIGFPEETDATYNDPRLAERMKALFRDKLGKDAVIDTQPIMGGEDFGQFGKSVQAPSLLFWVGERNEKDPLTTNHSPRFAPDFRATAPLAIRAMAAALLDLHRKPAQLN